MTEMKHIILDVDGHKVELYTQWMGHAISSDLFVSGNYIGNMVSGNSGINCLPTVIDSFCINGVANSATAAETLSVSGINMPRLAIVIEEELNIYWYGNEELDKELNKLYGEEVGRLLYKEFAKYSEDEYYGKDNYRFCEIGNKEQVKEYKRRRREGCCGSEDCEVEIKGVKYRIGFNYGH